MSLQLSSGRTELFQTEEKSQEMTCFTQTDLACFGEQLHKLKLRKELAILSYMGKKHSLNSAFPLNVATDRPFEIGLRAPEDWLLYYVTEHEHALGAGDLPALQDLGLQYEHTFRMQYYRVLHTVPDLRPFARLLQVSFEPIHDVPLPFEEGIIVKIQSYLYASVKQRSVLLSQTLMFAYSYRLNMLMLHGGKRLAFEACQESLAMGLDPFTRGSAEELLSDKIILREEDYDPSLIIQLERGKRVSSWKSFRYLEEITSLVQKFDVYCTHEVYGLRFHSYMHDLKIRKIEKFQQRRNHFERHLSVDWLQTRLTGIPPKIVVESAWSAIEAGEVETEADASAYVYCCIVRNFYSYQLEPSALRLNGSFLMNPAALQMSVEDVVSMLATTVEFLGDKQHYINLLINTIVFFYLFYGQKNWKHKAAAFYIWYQSMSYVMMTDQLAACVEFLLLRIERLDPSPEMEPSSSSTTEVSLVEKLIHVMERGSTTLSGFAADEMKYHIQTVLSFFVAHNLFGEKIDSSLLWTGLTSKELVKSYQSYEDVPSLVSSMFGSIAAILRRAFDVPSGACEFQIATDTDFLKCVRWLTEYKFRLVSCDEEDIPDGYVSEEIWNKNLQAALKKSGTLYVPKKRQIVFSMALRTLAQLYEEAQGPGVGKRPRATKIWLYSQPGSGKSTWIAMAFNQAIAEARKMFPSKKKVPSKSVIADSTAIIGFADKFMSTFDPVKHPFIVLDEVGSARPNMVPDNKIMLDLVSILGEADYFPAKAAVEEKGKHAMRNYGAIVCSNSMTGGIEEYLTNTDAVWRRIDLYFEVIVKEEYRAPGHSTHVDTSKVAGGNIDCVYFVPYKLEPSGPKKIYKEGSDSEVYKLSFAQARDLVYQVSLSKKTVKDSLDKTFALTQELAQTKCEHGFVVGCPKCHEDGEVNEVLSKIHKELIPSSYVYQPDCLSSYEFYSYVFVQFAMLVWTCFVGFSWWMRLKRWPQELLDQYVHYKYTMRKVENVTDAIESELNAIKIARSKIIEHGAKFCMALGTTAIACSLYNWAASKDENDELQQAGSILPGSPPVADHEITGNPWDTEKGFLEYGKAAGTPTEIFHKKIVRNMREISIIGPRGDEQGCTILGVKEQYFIGPAHTLKFFANPEYRLRVNYVRRSDGVTVNRQVCAESRHNMQGNKRNYHYLGNDLAMVRLTDVNAVPDILGYFVVQGNFIGGAKKLSASMVKSTMINLPNVPFDHLWTIEKGMMEAIRITYLEADLTRHKYDGFKMIGETNALVGQCGAPLIIGEARKSIAGLMTASIKADDGVRYKDHYFAPVNSIQLNMAISALEESSVVLSPYSALYLSEVKSLQGKTMSYATRRDPIAWMKPTELGSLEFLAHIDGVGFTPKTQVQWYKNGHSILEDLPEEYRHDLVQPKFNGYMRGDEYLSPEMNGLKQLTTQVTNINLDHLELAIGDVVSMFCEVSDFQKDHIIDYDTVLSGHDHNPLVKSMDLSKGSGFGFDGKKVHQTQPFPEGDERYNNARHGREPTPGFAARLEEIERRYADGKRAGHIMQYVCKDEPRAKKKVAERAIRLFSCAPMDDVCVTKKFYGMFGGVFMKRFLHLQSVSGANPFSTDWGLLFERLSKHPWVVNLDFSKYDKRTSVLMILAAFEVIHRVKEHFGKIENETHRNILKGVASECANPMVLILQMLLYIPGSLSSGHWLTMILNTIQNMLYIRLSYLGIGTVATGESAEVMIKTFRKEVEFYAGGDDNTFTISDKVRPWFHFKSIKEFYAGIGMKITPAQKDADDYEVEVYTEATIFKRRWLYDPEYRIWKCPIEKPTIGKMLTICLRSKSIPMEEQQRQAVEAAYKELAQHGRDEFEDIRATVLQKYFPDIDFDYDEILKSQADGGITPWIPFEMELSEIDLGEVRND
jgi:hypothetical protein